MNALGADRLYLCAFALLGLLVGSFAFAGNKCGDGDNDENVRICASSSSVTRVSLYIDPRPTVNDLSNPRHGQRCRGSDAGSTSGCPNYWLDSPTTLGTPECKRFVYRRSYAIEDPRQTFIFRAFKDDRCTQLLDQVGFTTGELAQRLIVSGTGLSMTEAGGSGSFTVKPSHDPGGILTVTIKASNIAGNITLNGKSQSIALSFDSSNWRVAQTVTVVAVDDNIDNPENKRTVVLGLTTGTAFDGSGPYQVEVIVRDDDEPYTVSIEAKNDTITEGQAATFILTSFPAAPVGGLVVNVEVSESGGDYLVSDVEGVKLVAVSGEQTTFSMSTIQDSTDEENGVITATVQRSSASPATYGIGRSSGASISVSDDDGPPDDDQDDRDEDDTSPPECGTGHEHDGSCHEESVVHSCSAGQHKDDPSEHGDTNCHDDHDEVDTQVRLAIEDATVVEGNRTMRFRVRRLPGSSLESEVTATWTVENLTTEDRDIWRAQWKLQRSCGECSRFYYGNTIVGELTLREGKGQGYVEVNVVNDDIREVDETFTVTLSKVEGALIGDGVAIGTIEDDDQEGSLLTIEDVEVLESAASAQLTVTLDEPSDSRIVFYWATIDGSATAKGPNKDYLGVDERRAVLEAGEVSHDITIEIVEDALREEDETFKVLLLSAVTPAKFSKGGATVTILGDASTAINEGLLDSVLLKLIRLERLNK